MEWLESIKFHSTHGNANIRVIWTFFRCRFENLSLILTRVPSSIYLFQDLKKKNVLLRSSVFVRYNGYIISIVSKVRERKKAVDW